jgi:hypothetical protein
MWVFGDAVSTHLDYEIVRIKRFDWSLDNDFPIACLRGIVDGGELRPYPSGMGTELIAYYSEEALYVISNNMIVYYSNHEMSSCPVKGKVLDCWNHEIVYYHAKKLTFAEIRVAPRGVLKLDVCDSFDSDKPAFLDMKNETIVGGNIPLFREIFVGETFMSPTIVGDFAFLTHDAMNFVVNVGDIDPTPYDLYFDDESIFYQFVYSNDKVLLIPKLRDMGGVYLLNKFDGSFVPTGVFRTTARHSYVVIQGNTLLVCDGNTLHRLTFVEQEITPDNLYSLMPPLGSVREMNEDFRDTVTNLTNIALRKLDTVFREEEPFFYPSQVPPRKERIAFQALAKQGRMQEKTFLLEDGIIVIPGDDAGRFGSRVNLVREDGIEQLYEFDRNRNVVGDQYTAQQKADIKTNFFDVIVDDYGPNLVIGGNRLLYLNDGNPYVLSVISFRSIEIRTEYPINFLTTPITQRLNVIGSIDDFVIFSFEDSFENNGPAAFVFLTRIRGQNLELMRVIPLPSRYYRTYSTRYRDRQYFVFDDFAGLLANEYSYLIGEDDCIRISNFVMLGPAGHVLRVVPNQPQFAIYEDIEYGRVIERGYATDEGGLLRIQGRNLSDTRYQLFSNGTSELIPFKVLKINSKYAVVQKNGVTFYCKILRPSEGHALVDRAEEILDLDPRDGPNQRLVAEMLGIMEDYTRPRRTFEEFVILGEGEAKLVGETNTLNI